MKAKHFHNSATARSRSTRALTLTEMLVTMSIFSLMTIGMLQIHLFGLHYDAIVESKLGATDQARRVFSDLLQDIHSAKVLNIGTGSQTSFTPVADGQLQQGTALQISLTLDTNNFIRYYFDRNKSELHRLDSVSGNDTLIAQNLTNTQVTNITIFQITDYSGTNILTSTDDHTTVGVKLEFYEYKYPLTKVGPGYYYDYYKLESKITRRTLD